jgi:hypothetical protein
MQSCHAIPEDELLDPSTGAASSAEYEFINGRFVETLLARSPTAAAMAYDPTEDLLPHCKEFENLLLDKKGWDLFVESWERDFIKY